MTFDPTAKRFNYTSGGELTLTGSDYIGYFNVDADEIWTGRYKDSQSKELLPTSRLKSDLYLSNYFQDRVIVDNLSLPNTLDEILIPENEIVTSQIFSSCLNRIYENTLYMYSKLFIASNDIPVSYSSWAGISASTYIDPTQVDSASGAISGLGLQWFPSDVAVTTERAEYIGYDALDELNKLTAIQSTSNTYFLFGITNTELVVLESDEDRTTISVTFSSSFVDSNTDKEYVNIADISINGDNLYMVDSSENYLYSYNILGYTKDDNILQNSRQLLKIQGGHGDADDKSKYDSPNVVESGSDRVYVADSGNNCVKIYDTNLAWINTYNFTLDDISVVDIKYNKLFDNVFVVFRSKLKYDFFIWIFNKDFTTVIDKFDINEQYEQFDLDVGVNEGDLLLRNNRIFLGKEENGVGEEILGIEFSSQDSNILYIYTDSNIYKKFISTPTKTIGKWRLNARGVVFGFIWNFIDVEIDKFLIPWNQLSGKTVNDIIVKSISIIPTDGNFDDIFALVYTSQRDAIKILYANEYTLYDSALQSGDVDLYNSTRSGTLEDEYINAFTINKELYKQVFNIVSLKNLLRGRFISEYDKYNSLVYKQYEYIATDELEELIIENVENLQIHDNEHVSSEVINRSLRKIYQFQSKMLDVTRTNIKNISPVLALTGTNIVAID